MDLYLSKLTSVYEKSKDEVFSLWSEKYMRGQFPFLGIRTPIRRKITNQFFKENGFPEAKCLEKTISLLWEMPEREYQYAALDLLIKVRGNLKPGDMDWIEKLILEKSWWDTVDVLSPHIAGYLFQKFPAIIQKFADKWIEEENFWLQRAAILFQLRYKAKTDEEKLYQFTLRRADSGEFFVQKAIGWALREYAKTNPDRVLAFLSEYDLKPLSRREALKHLSQYNRQ